eukprot:ctg_874.g432
MCSAPPSGHCWAESCAERERRDRFRIGSSQRQGDGESFVGVAADRNAKAAALEMVAVHGSPTDSERCRRVGHGDRTGCSRWDVAATLAQVAVDGTME